MVIAEDLIHVHEIQLHYWKAHAIYNINKRLETVLRLY